jgi:hypothetical protein
VLRDYVRVLGEWIENHRLQNKQSLHCARLRERPGLRCFQRSILRVGKEGAELALELQRLQQELLQAFRAA